MPWNFKRLLVMQIWRRRWTFSCGHENYFKRRDLWQVLMHHYLGPNTEFCIFIWVRRYLPYGLEKRQLPHYWNLLTPSVLRTRVCNEGLCHLWEWIPTELGETRKTITWIHLYLKGQSGLTETKCEDQETSVMHYVTELQNVWSILFI